MLRSEARMRFIVCTKEGTMIAGPLIAWQESLPFSSLPRYLPRKLSPKESTSERRPYSCLDSKLLSVS